MTAEIVSVLQSIKSDVIRELAARALYAVLSLSCYRDDVSGSQTNTLTAPPDPVQCLILMAIGSARSPTIDQVAICTDKDIHPAE